MILFKAAGETYGRVARSAVHAFPYPPAEERPHELILLSKNREDCRQTECQIQYVAKLLSVRLATSQELEERFPAVGAGERWKFFADMYWSRKLEHPFNLTSVYGVNARRYDTVQHFARFDEQDEKLILKYLFASNSRLMIDLAINAEPPDL